MTSVPFGGPVYGDTVHDTSQFWGGWQITIGGATGVGQTFTAPPDNILGSFTVYLGGANQASPTTFEAFVMAWSTDKLIGSVLFQSDPQLATSDPTIPFSFLYRWSSTSDWDRICLVPHG